MLKRDEIDVFVLPVKHELSKEDCAIFKKYHRTRRRHYIICWLWPLLGMVMLCTYVAICLAH